MGVAIVTGAGRGIGAAIARALHADGHRLVLVDRGADDPRLDYPLASVVELEAVAAACDATVVLGDVADIDTSRRAVATATEHFGGVDIAVAAAGVMAATAAAWDLDDDAWQSAWSALVGTNIDGTIQLARAAVPAMLERPLPRQGRFVGLSSAIALKATPSLAGYAASKATVLSFVRSMAADLGGTGVTANVVQPGSTDTDLLARSAAIYGLERPDELAGHHIDPRVLAPTEVAAAVAWLCSPAAAAITGVALPVDGGMTAR